MLNITDCGLALLCDSLSVMSLLQTPPVVRKTAILLRDATADASVSKPQSILSAARHKHNAACSTAARLTWDGMYLSTVSGRQFGALVLDS